MFSFIAFCSKRHILLFGEVVLTLLSCSNTISICVFIVATHNNNNSRSKCGEVTMRNTSRAEGLLLSFQSLWTLRSKFSCSHLRSQIKRTMCSAREYVSCLYCNFCCIMVIKSNKENFCSYFNRKFLPMVGKFLSTFMLKARQTVQYLILSIILLTK